MKYKVEIDLHPSMDGRQVVWNWTATAYAPGEDLIGVASAVLYSDGTVDDPDVAQIHATERMQAYLAAKKLDTRRIVEIEV